MIGIGAPRRLAKRGILEGVIKPLGLNRVKEENFYFVALTWDRENRVFSGDDGVEDNFLPMFLDEDWNSVYDQIAVRLGWLGYKQLEGGLELKNGMEYLAALRTMVPNNEPNEEDYDKASRAVWDKYSEEIVKS